MSNATTCQQPHSILISDPASVDHSHQHVQFTIPKEHLHTHENSRKPRSRTNSPPNDKTATPEVPMDEVELLKRGLRSQKGECLHDAEDCECEKCANLSPEDNNSN
ncbi:unnamed protein product [Bursaphelenchus okinawaensis]|uniref:Uncharacterized protein n=1 Tax=Bursaphelenchus okinawaensis TaxID=465554 RepID=A0A811KGR5_9BILA|nr:unnamed protein product [Bursaphelenchus okinawaensis]CAG9101961.1 unnamed protein product [Bursaphelenchus okinawaensis]